MSFLKVQLNTNYGVSALKYRFAREKKKLWEPILIASVIIITFVPLLVLYTLFMSGVFNVGSGLGQPEIVLTIAFISSQVMIFLFGLFYIMGTFYFSKDLESIIPLPLKPYEVVGGKFAVIMINEYLTSVPILLPPLIIYGVRTGRGLFYWLKSVMLLFTAPAIPLLAATLLIMVLMRFINFKRYKDLFAVIGGLAAMSIGICINMFIQNTASNSKPDYFTDLIAGNSGLIEAIGRNYPPSIWITKGLINNGMAGLGNFLLYLATCFAMFLLLLWLSNIVFYKALLAGQEVYRKTNKTAAEKGFRRELSPVSAMMKREWKLLFRTPVYALNGLAGTIIGPLMILVMLVAQTKDEGVRQLLDTIINPDTRPFVLLGGLGFMLFTAGMNLVASTALSREGKSFWISKMIPVPARQQVTSKLLLSYYISVAGVIVTGLIIWLFFNLPLLWILGAALVGFIGTVPMVALNLLVDIFHPKLVWNNEQEAMKQNMNGLLGLLISWLIMLIFAAVSIIFIVLGIPVWVLFITLGALSALLGLLSVLALFKVADKKYKELEA